MISLEVPVAIPSLANLRGEWRKARAVSHIRETVGWHLAAHNSRKPPVGTHVRVTLARVSARRLDKGDNHRTSLKPVRDEVAKWLGYRSDDGPEIDWQYGAQRKPARSRWPGYQAAAIEIEVLQPPAAHRRQRLGEWLEANAPPSREREQIAQILRDA